MKTFVKKQSTGDYFAKYMGANSVLHGKLLRVKLVDNSPAPMFCAQDYPEHALPIPLGSFEGCTVDEVLAAFPHESKTDFVEVTL